MQRLSLGDLLLTAKGTVSTSTQKPLLPPESAGEQTNFPSFSEVLAAVEPTGAAALFADDVTEGERAAPTAAAEHDELTPPQQQPTEPVASIVTVQEENQDPAAPAPPERKRAPAETAGPEPWVPVARNGVTAAPTVIRAEPHSLPVPDGPEMIGNTLAPDLTLEAATVVPMSEPLAQPRPAGSVIHPAQSADAAPLPPPRAGQPAPLPQTKSSDSPATSAKATPNLPRSGRPDPVASISSNDLAADSDDAVPVTPQETDRAAVVRQPAKSDAPGFPPPALTREAPPSRIVRLGSQDRPVATAAVLPEASPKPDHPAQTRPFVATGHPAASVSVPQQAGPRDSLTQTGNTTSPPGSMKPLTSQSAIGGRAPLFQHPAEPAPLRPPAAPQAEVPQTVAPDKAREAQVPAGPTEQALGKAALPYRPGRPKPTPNPGFAIGTREQPPARDSRPITMAPASTPIIIPASTRTRSTIAPPMANVTIGPERTTKSLSEITWRDPLSGDLEFQPGPRSDPIGGHGSAPVANLPARADLPQHVARQMTEALQQAPGRPVEISLSPEELGRVRLSLTSIEGAITVTVLAERPETIDLMRRHIAELHQQFQSIGYSNINFAFSGEGEAPQQSTPEEQGHAGSDALTDVEPVAKDPGHSLAIRSEQSLDLRL